MCWGNTNEVCFGDFLAPLASQSHFSVLVLYFAVFGGVNIVFAIRLTFLGFV